MALGEPEEQSEVRMRIRLAGLAASMVAGVLVLGSVRAQALGASTPNFLTLPFTSTVGMHIQRGWWTLGTTGKLDLLHHALDYIKGVNDVPLSWRSFSVAAAAGGEACAAKLGQTGCYNVPGEVMGNRVLIRHTIDGVTYYTFYNHLKTIDPSIPLNDRNKTVHVNQGQVIGVAGASGNDPTLIHLHFELQDAHHKWIDPYGLYSASWNYPDPAGTKNHLLLGPDSYWTTNPPTIFGAMPKPTPRPTRSPSGTASSTPNDTPEGSAAADTISPATTLPSGGAAAGAASPTAPPEALLAPTNLLDTPAPSQIAKPMPQDGGPDPVQLAAGIAIVAALLVVLAWALARRRGKGPARRG